VPRRINLTVPHHRRDDLLAELGELELLGLQLHRDASIRPLGDVITLEIANETLRSVMRIADRHGLGQPDGVSMSTAEPLSVISASGRDRTREHGATTWEELELSMEADSTMTAEKVAVMGFAGFIAGIGILSNAIHVVIGAMVIAPGFQPFARFVLGLITRSRGSWSGGLLDVGRAYSALVTGAALAAVLGLVFGSSPLDSGGPSYLGDGLLVEYWTSITWTGVVVGAVAGVCGGVLMSINRTVLTAGVMVALALVPSASLVSMSLVAGDVALAAQALLRFLVEVVLVLGGSAVVFAGKRYWDQRSSVD
jgi:hypothetical protein